MEAAKRESRDQAIRAVAAPIQFLPQKEQLLKRRFVKAERKELVSPFRRS
jgi:hypothetical protein